MTDDYLCRPRDLAITDFRFGMRAESVLVGRSGRKYLVYAHTRVARSADDTVPELTRRLVEWTLGTLLGGFVATTIWFGFLARDEYRRGIDGARCLRARIQSYVCVGCNDRLERQRS